MAADSSAPRLGPGHQLTGQSLGRLGLAPIDADGRCQLIVRAVHKGPAGGAAGVRVEVLNAFVERPGLVLDGIAVPAGAVEPVFDLSAASCCPVASTAMEGADRLLWGMRVLPAAGPMSEPSKHADDPCHPWAAGGLPAPGQPAVAAAATNESPSRSHLADSL